METTPLSDLNVFKRVSIINYIRLITDTCMVNKVSLFILSILPSFRLPFFILSDIRRDFNLLKLV